MAGLRTTQRGRAAEVPFGVPPQVNAGSLARGATNLPLAGWQASTGGKLAVVGA
jgi:hypothetical protein